MSESPVDRLVREVARQESAAVFADALAQAKEAVRDKLARRIEQAIMAELTPAETVRPADTVQPVSPQNGDEVGLYAYGITGDVRVKLDDVPTVGDGSARVIEHDGLGLVVSDVRLAELATLDTAQPFADGRLAELARRHDAVVRAVFDQGTILPLRFGTVLADTDAVVRLLQQQHQEAMATLEQIRGTREWGTKVIPNEPRQPDDADTETEPSSGTEYLMRKRSQLVERKAALTRRRELLDHAHSALAAHAADSVSRSVVGDEVLLDTAYLVPDAATDDFLARVDQVADELANHELSLRVTGPWPPYSFAVLERANA